MRGREFTESEVQSDARVAVVNEPFASEFGSTADTVGRQATTGNNPSWRIIGVVKGMDSMADEPNAPQIFVPAQLPGGFFSTFAARVDGRAEDRFAMIRDAIQSVDPQVPVFGVKTMEQRLGADQQSQNSVAHEYRVPSGSDDVVRVFYLTHIETPQSLWEIATAIRTVTDLQQVFTCNATKALTLHATADRIALAAKQISLTLGGPHLIAYSGIGTLSRTWSTGGKR